MRNKRELFESFLSALADYYDDNSEGTEYLYNNLSTTSDLELYTIKHNIDINYEAPSQSATIESIKDIIDQELKSLHG